MAMTTSLIVFPLAIGAGALAGNIRMDIFRSLENGLLIQYGPDVAKHSVERWIKIAATMVYSIGKRMVEFKFSQLIPFRH